MTERATPTTDEPTVAMPRSVVERLREYLNNNSDGCKEAWALYDAVDAALAAARTREETR